MAGYFTNYLFRNEKGEIVWMNSNTACFAEFANQPQIANITGTFEVFIPQAEIKLANPAQSIPEYIRFLSRAVLKCSVKFVEKTDFYVPDDESRARRLSENCWVVSIPLYALSGCNLKPSPWRIAPSFVEQSNYFKRIKILLHLVRFIYEYNFHYAVEAFLKLKAEKRRIKSKITDYALLIYAYSVLPCVHSQCRFWVGHSLHRTFDFKFKLNDNFINSTGWDNIAGSSFGKAKNFASILKTEEEFINFTKYIK